MIHGIIFSCFLFWALGNMVCVFIMILLCKIFLSNHNYSQTCSFLQDMLLAPCMYYLINDQNVKFIVSGDDLLQNESALVISNHVAHDYLPLYVLASNMGMLGNVRGILKNSIKYVPFIGWNMFLCGWLFLQRSWHNDKIYIRSKLNVMKKQFPVHLWLFPEGTRPTPEKKELSMQYECKRKLRPMVHVMQPRTKGFVEILQSNCFQIIYNVTLKYEGWESQYQPNFTSFLFHTKTPKIVYIHVNRVTITELTKTSKFCFDLFYEKELLLEHFKEHGKFPGKASEIKIHNVKNGFMFFTLLQLLLFSIYYFYYFQYY